MVFLHGFSSDLKFPQTQQVRQSMKLHSGSVIAAQETQERHVAWLLYDAVRKGHGAPHTQVFEGLSLFLS